MSELHLEDLLPPPGVEVFHTDPDQPPAFILIPSQDLLKILSEVVRGLLPEC